MKTITTTKRTLLVCAVLLSVFQGLNAQNYWETRPAPPLENGKPLYMNEIASKSQVSGVVDTLWYFFFKHFYRNPAPANTGFGSFSSPSSQGLGSPPLGSLFYNPGTVTVTGAEAICYRNPSSPSQSIPVRIYLFNVNAGNLPVLPPVDSLNTTLVGSSGGLIVGGDFATPHVMTSNYAIMTKNVSSVVGDSVLFYTNNALTPTATSTNNNAKYGEGCGLARIPNGTFIKLTGIFGAGTDREFLVAPRVKIDLTAGFSATSPTTCTDKTMSYSNTCSPFFSHRQYNLNEFYNRWAPFGLLTAVQDINPDSVYTWNFSDASGDNYIRTSSVNHTFTIPANYTVKLEARRQGSGFKSPAATGNNKTTGTFTLQTLAKDCNNLTSITGHKASSYLHLYPNPTYNGISVVSGFESGAYISVYSSSGVLLHKDKAQADNCTVDISAYPPGVYFIRVTERNIDTAVLKVVNF